jgi:uncharacterized protein with HEPN domain
MKGSLGDEQRIVHIVNAIIEIEEYTANADLLEFKSNSMLRFASIKQIEIIGEAASQITVKTKSNFPEIDWREIVALRNILVHEYFGIDANIVWQIIKNDIPDLKTKLLKSKQQ